MKNLLHTVRDTVFGMLPSNQGARRLRAFAVVQAIWAMQCIDGGQNVLFKTKQRLAEVDCLCHRVTVFDDLKALQDAGVVRSTKPWRRNESPLPKGVSAERAAHMREHGWAELTLAGPLAVLFEQTQAAEKLAEESRVKKQQPLPFRSPKQQYAIQKAIEDREAGRPRYSAPAPEPARPAQQPKPFAPSAPLQPIEAPPSDLHARIDALGRGIDWHNEQKPKPPS